MSGNSIFLASGCYKISQGNSPSPPVLIEHSCLMTRDNKWDIDVKCRPQRLSHVKAASHQTDSWRSLKEAYPDAKIEHKHNDIEVTLPSLQEDLEIAAFGRPGKDDQKRMQMATFGGRPSQGRNWKIWVYLVDDTTTAYKVLYRSASVTLGRPFMTDKIRYPCVPTIFSSSCPSIPPPKPELLVILLCSSPTFVKFHCN